MWSERARCPELNDSNAERSCEVTCTTGADCAGLDEDLGCADGVCRAQSASSEAAPLVMIVLDTSGSMERKVPCSCTTPSCEECLPDCDRAERNRWVMVLEALSGTWEDFQCDSVIRTDDAGADARISFSYDLNYILPYHRPPTDVPQLGDGVLDAYRARVRFGLAVFDPLGSYVGAPADLDASTFDEERSLSEEGMWSYGSRTRDDGHVVGVFRYPNSSMNGRMDTGIRGPQATEGAVRHAADVASMLEVNVRIQQQLRSVRPYGGTPIAAALDDVAYYLFDDPISRIPDGDTPHVVLITDGFPDDDFRSFGCDCVAELASNAFACGDPGVNDPAEMVCPYPTASEAAANRGTVHVIGIDSQDAFVTNAWHAIAAAGGTHRARLADNGSELRHALESILDEVLAAQRSPSP